jgi:hypothetical protein
MRRTLTLCRTALAGAAVAALVTACGGGSSNDSAATSSAKTTTSSSSSSSTPDPAAAQFCTQAAAAFSELQSTVTSQDPAQVVAGLQQLVASLDAIEAPPAITKDWQTLVDALKQLTTTAASLDLSTPEGKQQFEQAQTQLLGQVGAAQSNVSNYVTQNCSQVTGTPAPTS